MTEDLVFNPPIPVAFYDTGECVATANLERVFEDLVEISAFQDPDPRLLRQFKVDLSGFKGAGLWRVPPYGPALFPPRFVSVRGRSVEADRCRKVEGKVCLIGPDEGVVSDQPDGFTVTEEFLGGPRDYQVHP